MENKEERGKSLSANDEVAAAAEAHGEVSAAAEVAQSDPGAGLLILAQQSQVQGGGSLAGLEHQRAYALIHQGVSTLVLKTGKTSTTLNLHFMVLH